MRAVGGATSPAGTPNVGSSRHRTATLLGGLVATLALAGGLWLLAGEQSAAADEHLQGEIIDFDILVADEPLTVGDTIVFTNEGERPHTVTDRGDTFDTDGIQPGGTAEVIFDAAGTFEIFCRINPGSMNATVVVEPDDEPPEKVRVQTFDPNFDPHPEQLRFDPPELEVRPGTEVSVANVGGASHTLTANDATFDTGEIAPGAEEGRFPGANASFVVDELGEYAFRCLIHPEAMQGTLVVAGEPLDAEPEEPPPQEKPDPGPEADGDVVIAMADFSFDPFEVAVAPGAQMTWSNGGSAPHTATFDEVEGQVEGLDNPTMVDPTTNRLTRPPHHAVRCLGQRNPMVRWRSREVCELVHRSRPASCGDRPASPGACITSSRVRLRRRRAGRAGRRGRTPAGAGRGAAAGWRAGAGHARPAASTAR